MAPALVRRAHDDAVAFVGAPVRHREEREAELAVALAPGATRPVGAGVRLRPEAPDPLRLCFERDLDRVKHSRPWRRLAGKCQVFIAPENDHLRTRLTHAVEVAQVATGIARAANLCLPLVEAIALAHDCGHGPAGHASEEAFSPFLPGTGYDHAVYGADVTLAPLNLCVGDARRRAQPLVAPARARHRPRARWWPGPIASRTSATTSTTRCGPGSSTPTTCPPGSATSSGAGRRPRSGRSWARCSTPSTRPARSG